MSRADGVVDPSPIPPVDPQLSNLSTLMFSWLVANSLTLLSMCHLTCNIAIQTIFCIGLSLQFYQLLVYIDRCCTAIHIS